MCRFFASYQVGHTPWTDKSIMHLITPRLQKNYSWGWKLHTATERIPSETSCHSGQRYDCMHAVPGDWGALKFEWLFWIQCKDWNRRHVLPWKSMALFKAVCSDFPTWNFMILSLCTLSMEIYSCNQLSDTSCGGQNIYWVTIQICLNQKHCELRPNWICVVHGVSRCCRRSSALLLSRICHWIFFSQVAPHLLEPEISAAISNFEAYVDTNYLVNIKLIGVTEKPRLCIYASVCIG